MDARWWQICVAVGVILGAVGWSRAPAQSPEPRNSISIANNDSLFVDARTFKAVPGKGRRDVAGLVDTLGAKQMGPALLVFRSGEALYVVDTPVPPSAGEEDARSNRVHIEYVPPKNPEHQEIFEMAQQHRALETMQQVLAPLRLPIDVTLRTIGCDGIPNAWYQREGTRPVVSLCYEFLQELHDKMPKATTREGITPQDAVIGQLFYAVFHEMGHALFDIFEIPVFGREEDAADQFAAYVILRFRQDEARRLIRGAAYGYLEVIKADKKKGKIEATLGEFSSNHGTSEQRFYNLLCMAYGSDSTLFASLVENKYLPETRAKSCSYEYKVLAFAVMREIRPHVDLQMADAVFNKTWTLEPAPRPVAQK
jgi:hypothetical protein